ncbi:hypothetical protein BH23PSE2_BH23PSE2_10240 [soil metagenome]
MTCVSCASSIRPPGGSTLFTTVASYIDPIEARIAQGLLVSEGIDAHLGDEQIALANWEWRLAVGGTKLRVPSAQAERARSVLQAMEAGAYALEDLSDSQTLLPPERESPSSRLAWLALMLLSLPLPWRRRPVRDDEAVRIV